MLPSQIPPGTKARYTDSDATVTLTTPDGRVWRWDSTTEQYITGEQPCQENEQANANPSGNI